MTQGVTVALLPVKVQVLLPVFWKMPKPWYCAARPIVETSKLAAPLPPSRSVSVALNATTFPVMADPGCNSSTLVPPVKVMASERTGDRCPESPPVIAPLFITVRLAPRMPAPPAPAIKIAFPPTPPLIAPPSVIGAAAHPTPLRRGCPAARPPSAPAPGPPRPAGHDAGIAQRGAAAQKDADSAAAATTAPAVPVHPPPAPPVPPATLPVTVIV